MSAVMILSVVTCVPAMLFVLAKYERMMLAPGDNGWVLYVVAEVGPGLAHRLATGPSVREARWLWQLFDALPGARESGDYEQFDAAMSRLLELCRPATTVAPSTSPAEPATGLAAVRAA